MQKPSDPACTPLDDLGAIRVQGVDAVKFLQGQLSNDVTKLSGDNPLFAALHNPQGRVVALLRLVWIGPDDILAILPRELAATVASRLAKYVLRAKVKIADESANWQVVGWVTSAAPQESISIRIDPARWWVISPADETSALARCAALDREGWRALDIAAGLPQVYAATSEEFVAQMLNLDALGAIAWDKGCYTGQEIIARAHYRGQVKRRMQRFRAESSRDFKVVESVRRADGQQEFLAVAPLDAPGALALPYPIPSDQ